MPSVPFTYFPMMFPASTMTFSVMAPAGVMQGSMSSFFIPQGSDHTAISAPVALAIEMGAAEATAPTVPFLSSPLFAGTAEDVLARHGRRDTRSDHQATADVPPELVARVSPWVPETSPSDPSVASGTLYLDAAGAYTVTVSLDRTAGTVSTRFGRVSSASGSNDRLADVIADGLSVGTNGVPDPDAPIEIRLFGETIAVIRWNPATGRLELCGQVRQLQPFDLRQFAQQGEKYKDLWRLHRSAANVDHRPTIDLHTHFAGQMTADALIRVAARSTTAYPVALAREAGVDVPPELIRTEGGVETVALKDLVSHLRRPGNEAQLNAFLDALRIPAGKVIPFQEMETVYRFRSPIVKALENFAPFLLEIARQYQALGVRYAELSLSDIVKPEWLREAHRVLPAIEAITGVKLRFLVGLWRHNAPEFNTEEMGPKIIYIAEHSPYVVGVDFMGHETNSTRALTDQIAFFARYRQQRNPDFQVRVHAGENPLFPENVREAIGAGASRIGHGLYGFDGDALRSAKEKGVRVEFNSNSNRTLNNVDAADQSGIERELPILSYVRAGVSVTLGTDGQGIYGGGGTAESYVAAVAGLTPDDFDRIRSADESYASRQGTNFDQRSRGRTNPELPADFAIPRTELSAEFWADRAAKRERVRQALIDDLKRRGVEVVDDAQLDAFLAGRTPVLFSGASEKSWPKISPENQVEVRAAIDRCLAMLDPEKVVIVTGATNFGVEKIVHEIARQRGFVILGTIVEETRPSDVADGTITHATLVGDSWYAKSAPVLDMVRRHNGAVIFMGGGNILNDEIQAASNVGARFYLMKGPEGASTNKADIFSENAFVGADGMERIIVADMSELTTTEMPLASPALDETAVQGAFAPGTPAEETVEALSSDPQLRALYDVAAGYWERQTIGEHIVLALSRLEKYPLGQRLPDRLGGGSPVLAPSELTALLSIHDAGKFFPGQGPMGRTRSSQHRRSIAVLEAYADALGIPPEKVEIMKALIAGDPIGDLFRKIHPYRPPKEEFSRFAEDQSSGDRPIETYFAQVDAWAARIEGETVGDEERRQAIATTARAIVETARRLGVDPLRYLHLLTTYYQADCSAYTFDASTPSVKAKASTDYIFMRNERATSRDQRLLDFDVNEQRLSFSSSFETIYRELVLEVERQSRGI